MYIYIRRVIQPISSWFGRLNYTQRIRGTLLTSIDPQICRCAHSVDVQESTKKNEDSRLACDYNYLSGACFFNII